MNTRPTSLSDTKPAFVVPEINGPEDVLRAACGTENTSYSCKRPFTVGEHIYATDGVMAVRYPKQVVRRIRGGTDTPPVTTLDWDQCVFCGQVMQPSFDIPFPTISAYKKGGKLGWCEYLDGPMPCLPIGTDCFLSWKPASIVFSAGGIIFTIKDQKRVFATLPDGGQAFIALINSTAFIRGYYYDATIHDPSKASQVSGLATERGAIHG